MSKTIQGVLGAVVVVAAAVVLNPSPQHHRARIKAAIAERSAISGLLGIGALTAFASNYHSLVVASYTEAGGKTLSWGALGYVYVVQ